MSKLQCTDASRYHGLCYLWANRRLTCNPRPQQYFPVYVSHRETVVLVVVVGHLFFIRLGGGDLDWGLLAGHASLSRVE